MGVDALEVDHLLDDSAVAILRLADVGAVELQFEFVAGGGDQRRGRIGARGPHPLDRGDGVVVQAGVSGYVTAVGGRFGEQMLESPRCGGPLPRGAASSHPRAYGWPR